MGKLAPGGHSYVDLKTATELGITCLTIVAGSNCGAPVIWFDYQIGEKNHRSGFVCETHKVSNRVGKLAQPIAASVA